MGDMAEWVTDNGMAEWDAHVSRQCEDFCPYCADAEEKRERRKKAARKRLKAARAKKSTGSTLPHGGKTE